MESHEERAYMEVKKAIFQRLLLPGAPIREVELASYLGVSRTPIRQALRRLAREGLVEIQPNRGTFVVQPSTGEMRELFLLRSHLEGLSVRLAADRISKEQLDQLRQTISQEQAAYEQGQPWVGLGLSNAFHEQVAAAAGNARLSQYIGELIGQSYVYFALYDVYGSGCPRCSDEHQAILAAMAARDGAEAERRMVEHFDKQLAALKVVGVPGVAPWDPHRQA